MAGGRSIVSPFQSRSIVSPFQSVSHHTEPILIDLIRYIWPNFVIFDLATFGPNALELVSSMDFSPCTFHFPISIPEEKHPWYSILNWVSTKNKYLDISADTGGLIGNMMKEHPELLQVEMSGVGCEFNTTKLQLKELERTYIGRRILDAMKNDNVKKGDRYALHRNAFMFLEQQCQEYVEFMEADPANVVCSGPGMLGLSMHMYIASDIKLYDTPIGKQYDDNI